VAAISAALVCACSEGSGGASSSSGTGGAGASSSSDGSSTGGVADLCASYADVAQQDVVTIHITNARSAPVYMDGFCSFPFAIELAGERHEGGPSEWMPWTCASHMTKMVPCCDCSAPEWKLEPGEDVTFTWHGILYDLTHMPSECYAPPNNASAGCLVQTAAPAGPMKIVAHVFENYACPLTFCSPKDPLPAEKEFVYGTDSVVEITVE
jgi:hypothetical protein